MPGDGAVELHPITAAEADEVGRFLNRSMNGRLTPETWAASLVPPWEVDSPNHGFLLRHDGRIVGVYVAIYSQREVDGRVEHFCNLGTWYVLPDYRSHSVRLLRALLAQRGYHFTDLTPTPGVAAVSSRLGFRPLDTQTALVLNLPSPRLLSPRVRVTSDPQTIEQLLSGRDLDLYHDHAKTMAARHVVITRGTEVCYVMFRRVRRRKLPIFASVLYVSNQDLFRATASAFYGRLLLRHGLAGTLAELRIVGSRPWYSVTMDNPRPKMFRSRTLEPEQIDDLYSELACLAW